MTRHQRIEQDDQGISAVVGAILMIAVTVVIGATVYAVVNGFGDKETNNGPDAVFKAQSVDTDGDGVTDTIKISYLTGPAGVADSDVDITVKQTDGTGTATLGGSEPTSWNPGDFVVYTTAGSYFVTVSILDHTVVDTTLNIDE